MKIGILTHPLVNNYGGILQNFALQYVLEQLGHQVATVNIDIDYHLPLLRMCGGWFNRLRMHYLKGMRVPLAFNPKPSSAELDIINRNTLDFIRRNIKLTETVTHFYNLPLLDKKYNFDAYVIGSDQVWNPQLCPWYFGSFTNRNDVKFIAYAASFGHDEWRMNQDLTAQCAELAKKFSAISVREKSAVRLCQEYLGVDAKHVIDPTLLLSKEIYLKRITIAEEKNVLFSYILDQDDCKTLITKTISENKGLSVRTSMPNETYLRGLSRIENCIYPSFNQWINGFNNAEFVVTDSFHGTVFAILFNVPFVAIGNRQRGMTRFKSLLKTFGLEDRLVSNPEEAYAIANKPINYTPVNEILTTERQKALDFLNNIS